MCGVLFCVFSDACLCVVFTYRVRVLVSALGLFGACNIRVSHQIIHLHFSLEKIDATFTI